MLGTYVINQMQFNTIKHQQLFLHCSSFLHIYYIQNEVVFGFCTCCCYAYVCKFSSFLLMEKMKLFVNLNCLVSLTL